MQGGMTATFYETEYPELPITGLFKLLENAGKEKRLVAKLGIDTFYHHLCLPDHLLTYFGLQSTYI